ncbi:MAG: hypothetical protein ABI863_20115 [Ginsengibacter sp.]
MHIKASIKLKAAILFIVFASNTVLGFACAVGVNASLLKRIIYHIGILEATGSSLNMQAVEKKAPEKDDCCKKGNDNCCNKKVVSFEQLDKSINQPVTAKFVMPVFELPSYLSFNTKIYSGTSISVLNNIFRNLHSPPEDIRVSIRSFQI